MKTGLKQERFHLIVNKSYVVFRENVQSKDASDRVYVSTLLDALLLFGFQLVSIKILLSFHHMYICIFVCFMVVYICFCLCEASAKCKVLYK